MSLVKNEDFIQFRTVMEGMIGESLLLFCTRFNYGTNFHDLFHEVFQHEYIHKGSIVRRSPGNGIIRAEELFFVIEIDAQPSPIEIPPELWKYAFEKVPKSSLPFRVRPEVTVKLALISVEQGLVLIAPISLLLLLCQRQFLIEMIHDGDLPELSRQWEQTYSLLNNCALIPSEKTDKAPAAPISTLDLYLYLPSEAIDNLFEILNRDGPHPLKAFVEECWTLIVPKFDRRKGKYESGNSFEWVPIFIRDETRQQLLEEWRNSPRIRRCSEFGKPFAIDFEYADLPGLRPSSAASWKTTKILLLRPEDAPVPPAVNLRDSEEYSVPELFYPPIPTIAKYYRSTALSDFTAFYRDEFNRVLKVVEWHGPYLLLREAEIYDIARETKEGQEKWAKIVAAARAKKLAEKGIEEEQPETKPVVKASNLGMTWQQRQVFDALLTKLKELHKTIDDLVNVRSKSGYEQKELFEIFTGLMQLKSEIDKFMESSTTDTSLLDAEYFPAFDKFSAFVGLRKIDDWNFGNVPPKEDEGDKPVFYGLPSQVNFVDVLVQDTGLDFPDQGNLGGTQSFLSLITSSGRPTRFFLIDTGKTIQEEKIDYLQYGIKQWMAKATASMLDLFCRVLTIKAEFGFISDAAWGDVLGNVIVQQLRKDPAGVQYILMRWRFDSLTEVYVRYSEKELALYKTLKRKTLTKPEPQSAAVVHLQWEKLLQENPSVYKDVAEELNQMIANAPKIQEKEAVDIEQSEQEGVLPDWMKDVHESWTIIKESKDWIEWQDENGNIVIEPSEDANLAEDLAGEYLDLEDEDDIDNEDL